MADKKESELKKIFGDKRIIALVGEKNSGKTNNLVFLIKEYREQRKDVPIYVYGFPDAVMDYLKVFGVIEISSIKHLKQKRNCIIFIDEMERLKLPDRRYKEQLDEFIDFIYHNNCYVIFSSPNIREFNSVIGGVIERWMLKTVRVDSCVNGSQLKQVVDSYRGRFKSLGVVEMPLNQILVINDNEEVVVDCEYIKQADSKTVNKDLF